jgi:hypothetical protein
MKRTVIEGIALLTPEDAKDQKVLRAMRAKGRLDPGMDVRWGKRAEVREGDDDHFYGPWKGGSKAEGGRPGGAHPYAALDPMSRKHGAPKEVRLSSVAGLKRDFAALRTPKGVAVVMDPGSWLEDYGGGLAHVRSGERTLGHIEADPLTGVMRYEAVPWGKGGRSRGFASAQAGVDHIVTANADWLREASSDDHFYGPWKGGSKGAGGRPVKVMPHHPGPRALASGPQGDPDAVRATREQVAAALDEDPRSLVERFWERVRSDPVTLDTSFRSQWFGRNPLGISERRGFRNRDALVEFLRDRGMTAGEARLVALEAYAQRGRRMGTLQPVITEAAALDRAIEVFAVRIREAEGDDHFYGPWRGGKASEGGGPASKLGRGTKEERRQEMADRVGAENVGNIALLKKGKGRGAMTGDIPPYEAGEAPLPEGHLRVYHYTNDIDSVRKDGLDTKHAKGETYGEPNYIWVSAEKPGVHKDFVEMHIRPDELAIGSPSGPVTQAYIDQFHAHGSNATLQASHVSPERFVTWQTEETKTYSELHKRYPPGDPSAWRGTSPEQTVSLYRSGMGMYERGYPQTAKAIKRWLADVEREGRLREAADDDHFYGPWRGGKRSEGGGPASEKGRGTPEERRKEMADRVGPENVGNTDLLPKGSAVNEFAASRAVAADVASWADTKPWEMSDEDLRAGKAPGVRVDDGLTGGAGESHGNVDTVMANAGYADDRYIRLGPAALAPGKSLPRERVLMGLMYHEAGHRTGANYADVKDVLDQHRVGPNEWRIPGISARGGHDAPIRAAELGETIADAYGRAMMFGTEGQEGGQLAFTKAVLAAAERNGFPTRAFRAEFVGEGRDRRPVFIKVQESRPYDRLALRSLREGDDDHFYGPWKGGSKAEGGRPGGGGAAASNPALDYLRDATGAKRERAIAEAVAKVGAITSHEEGYLIDPAGTVLVHERGDAHSVGFKERDLTPGIALVHGHPHGEGLSLPDVEIAVRRDLASVTAAGVTDYGKRWRYTLERPDGGWPADFPRRYQAAQRLDSMRMTHRMRTQMAAQGNRFDHDAFVRKWVTDSDHEAMGLLQGRVKGLKYERTEW